MSTSQDTLPTPSFVRIPGPGGEGDSFGLQGGGSSLGQAGFSRGFWAALRSRLPLRKGAGRTRDNPFPPGFLIHRSPRRATPAWENWGWTSSARSSRFSQEGLILTVGNSPPGGGLRLFLHLSSKPVGNKKNGYPRKEDYGHGSEEQAVGFFDTCLIILQGHDQAGMHGG